MFLVPSALFIGVMIMTNKEIEQQLEYTDVMADQPLDEEERELLEVIYDRLDIFQQKNSPYHETARKCRQIVHMEDPDQDNPLTLEQNKKPTLQLQSLKSTYNNVVADQMLSMPEAKILPETVDKQEAADDLQDLVHHVLYCTNNFEQIHYRRCEDFYGPGTAVTEIAWDPDMNYGKGDIALIRWPIEAFLWDPTAENVQDCRAVMKVSWHPLSWYKAHFPKEGKYVGVDKFTHNNVGMTEGQEDAEHADDEERALLIEYWWREYNASTRRYTINVAYAAGNALLDVHKDVYAHGMFPFVVDVHDTIEGCLAGEGLVHELVPMMRYINRYAAYADMNARMASKGRLLIRKGSGIDREALADWDNDMIEGDNITPDNLQWLQNQPFNGTIIQLMTMMQSDLKADSGANQFTRGETTGGIVSGKAINSLIQAGGKISSMRTEQLKYGFKQIVEQIIWLMAQFCDKKRTVLVTGRKGNQRSIDIDPEKLFGKKLKGAVAPPPYTVQIEVSSRDPQRVANQNQMYMEAYTMAAQAQQNFPLSALFRILNLDGKDKILPVIEENEHYQEQLMMLQQQLEQAQMQIEQLTEKNQTLKSGLNTAKNTLATMGKRGGNNIAPPADGSQMKLGSADSGQTTDAIVNQMRNTLGQPLGGEPLPT